MLILDINRVLLASTISINNLALTADTRQKKLVVARPFVNQFLERALEHFDVGIWSCMRFQNVKRQVDLVISKSVIERLKFVLGQETAYNTGSTFPDSDKPIFLKPLSRILFQHPEYLKEDVILVDDSPYKTSINALYSSLYPVPFELIPGTNVSTKAKDTFLLSTLLPYLLKILGISGNCNLHKAIENNYPAWSADTLEKDYTSNKLIWEKIFEMKFNHHPEHLAKFSAFFLSNNPR